jgi:hypothetical protein
VVVFLAGVVIACPALGAEPGERFRDRGHPCGEAPDLFGTDSHERGVVEKSSALGLMRSVGLDV